MNAQEQRNAGKVQAAERLLDLHFDRDELVIDLRQVRSVVKGLAPRARKKAEAALIRVLNEVLAEIDAEIAKS